MILFTRNTRTTRTVEVQQPNMEVWALPMGESPSNTWWFYFGFKCSAINVC